jgi:hypothetical protein
MCGLVAIEKDAIAEDSIRMRRQRSVVLGSVRELGVRDARRLWSQKLAAINQGTHKPELMMTFERFAVERWEPNIHPMLRYSTARARPGRFELDPLLRRQALATVTNSPRRKLISRYEEPSSAA